MRLILSKKKKHLMEVFLSSIFTLFEESIITDLDTSTKEDGTESDNEVKANEIEMNNLALMAEDLDQENTKKEEREGGDEDAQNVPEIAEEDEFSKLQKIKLSFRYWRFQ